MAIILKILATLLGSIALIKTLLAYRAKEESFIISFLWCIVWLLVMIVAWWPIIIARAVEQFDGRSTTVGQITGIGFVLLIFILYRLYLKSHRADQKIVSIVRYLALTKDKKNKK